MIRTHTPVTTFIAIDGLWLESAQQIEWQETIARRPLYGVLSTEFKDLTKGRLSVSGTLGVYFDSLGSFSKALLNAGVRQAKRDAILLTNGIDIDSVVTQFVEAPDISTSIRLLSDLQIIRAKGDPAQKFIADQVINKLNTLFIGGQDVEPTSINLKYSNPLDLEKITKIKDMTMDIIYFQRSALATGSRTKTRENDPLLGERFVDVRFMGKAKGFANAPKQSGQPIMEFYQFVAKRVEDVVKK